jgi:hypothetical protein
MQGCTLATDMAWHDLSRTELSKVGRRLNGYIYQCAVYKKPRSVKVSLAELKSGRINEVISRTCKWAVD